MAPCADTGATPASRGRGRTGPCANRAPSSGCGILSVAIYGLRLLFEGRGFEWGFAYIPILGGVIEIAVVFLFWMAILQAWRASRPLRREWRLWVGALLALVPPVVDLTAYVLTAR